MSRLKRISYHFPAQVAGAGEFFAALGGLLSPVPGVDFADTTLQATPQWPSVALPTTVLSLTPAASIEIVFAMEETIDLLVGPLLLRSNERGATHSPSIDTAASDQPPTLPLAIIAARLAGHITALDHTGVNLPTALLDDDHWLALLRTLSREAALYRYPGGEPWPFILPTTAEEWRDDIRTFAPGRVPKFELVHDNRAVCPVLQFALVTDLTREETEALFPAPQGVAFPDLGHLFRTVYAEHPWPGLLIRFDLTYRGPVTDWDTGEWLVARQALFE